MDCVDRGVSTPRQLHRHVHNRALEGTHTPNKDMYGVLLQIWRLSDRQGWQISFARQTESAGSVRAR